MNYNKLSESKQDILDEKYNCYICNSNIKNENPYFCYICQKIFHEKCLKDLKRIYTEGYNVAKALGVSMPEDYVEKKIKFTTTVQAESATSSTKQDIDAGRKTEIDSLLGSLNLLIIDTQSIENEISIKEADYQAACAAEEAAKSKSKSCDPIGFIMGKGSNQVRYDFIIDDGAFDSTSDFLGADNNWASMEALDVNGDGTVSAKELSDNNIKMVKTDASGKKTVVDIASEFGDDFSIDLSSYAKGGSHYAIDSGADADGDGVVDQEVLGTFNVNINGQSILGYNTLDDVDYLESEYGLSAGAQSVAQQDAFGELSSDLAPHGNFFNEYTAKSAQLKAELDEAMVNFGITEDNIEGIKQQAEIAGNEQANIFMEELEEKLEAEKEAEEKEAAEKKAAEEKAAEQKAAEEAAAKADGEDDASADDEDEEDIEELRRR